MCPCDASGVSCALQLQNLLEAAQADSVKERKLRERSELFSTEIEHELEVLKQQYVSQGHSSANQEAAQEVLR